MARFEGAGALLASGSKVHDMRFENEGGLQMDGGDQAQVRGCFFRPGTGNTALLNPSGGSLLVTDSWFDGACIAISGASGALNFLTVKNCRFVESIKAIVTTGIINQEIVIANNLFVSTEETAIELVWARQVVIEGNTFLACVTQVDTGAVITADSNCFQVVIDGNTFADLIATPAVLSEGDQTTITNNTLEGSFTGVPSSGLLLDGVQGFAVAANTLLEIDGHGIEIVDCADGDVIGNQLENIGTDSPANTRDGINITTSDRVLVVANHINPEQDVGQIRYGINIVSGNNNAVYANFLGDSSDYGTADSADTATGTQTSPAAGAIGGQFAF